MKFIIKNIFILFFVCFSFFYTDRVISFINKNSPLMKTIEDNKDYYMVYPVNSITFDDTIIPGINGKKVNVLKSYDEMKGGGVFREELLVYDDITPFDILSFNKDKYITKGNNINKYVSLVIIFNYDDLSKLNDMSLMNIFISHKYLTIENINKLKNNEIYTYGNDGNYNSEILNNDNMIVNRIANNDSIYCLTKEKNSSVLNVCSKNNMYTIIPSILGGYLDIKNNLSNGSIILLDNLNNIDVIIKYITGKGYTIVPLSKLLKE